MMRKNGSAPRNEPRLFAAALAIIVAFWLGVSYVHGVISPEGAGFWQDLLNPEPPTLVLRVAVAALIASGAWYTQTMFDRYAATVRTLEHERSKLQMVYDHSPDAVIVLDPDYTVRYANPATKDLTKVDPEALVGRRCYEAVLGLDGPCEGCMLEEVVRTHAPQTGVKHSADSSRGELWIESTFYPVLAPDGSIESVVETARDITNVRRAEVALQEYSERLEREVHERTAELEHANELLTEEIAVRRRAEKALRESEERFRSLVEMAPDLILVHIEGVVSFINPNGARMLGYEDPRDLLGTHVLEFVDPAFKDRAAEALRTTVIERRSLPPTEFRFVRKDGTTIDVQITSTPLMYHGRPAVQAVAHDITERKRAEETIRKMAYYDLLTGLPNRALFDDRLAVAISRAEREDSCFAVMFMDINDFKLVNDSLGHAVGDALLAEIGRRLSKVVRRSDTVARLGGDEFTLLLPQVTSRKAAGLIARKIVKALEEPLITEEGAVPIDVSIGIAFYPTDGRSFSELMHAADMAMYASKNDAVPFAFADPSLVAPAKETAR
ncbi:MAG: diguanylate cyclase [Coriobacteriia bacterium]|nr:diguanylate cyclase [Coriobacteriia bacterium]